VLTSRVSQTLCITLFAGVLLAQPSSAGQHLVRAATKPCNWEVSRGSGVPNSVLYGVATYSSGAVWAVGLTYPYPSAYGVPFFEHYDGGVWTSGLAPNPNYGDVNGLGAASAGSSTDAWAVGFAYDLLSGGSASIVEHWQGIRWHVVHPGTGGLLVDALNSVVAFSPTDVWAAGHAGLSSSSDGYDIVEHFDGRRWRFSLMVTDTRPSLGFTSIRGSSQNDIWAVGSSAYYAEHYDGKQWTQVALPNPALQPVAVTDSAPNDAWIAAENDGGPYAQAQMEHWNGKAWSLVATPNVPGKNNTLTAITSRPDGRAWAVGYTGDSQSECALALYRAPRSAAQWMIQSVPPGCSHLHTPLSDVSATAGDVLGGRHW